MIAVDLITSPNPFFTYKGITVVKKSICWSHVTAPANENSKQVQKIGIINVTLCRLV